MILKRLSRFHSDFYPSGYMHFSSEGACNRGASTMSNIMNTDQICQAFGISKSTLNNWRKEKGLPYIKVGRTVRYDFDAVVGWLKKHEVTSPKTR